MKIRQRWESGLVLLTPWLWENYGIIPPEEPGEFAPNRFLIFCPTPRSSSRRPSHWRLGAPISMCPLYSSSDSLRRWVWNLFTTARWPSRRHWYCEDKGRYGEGRARSLVCGGTAAREFGERKKKMFFLGPIGFPRSLRWDNIVHLCFFLCFWQGMDQKKKKLPPHLFDRNDSYWKTIDFLVFGIFSNLAIGKKYFESYANEYTKCIQI
jgi:hypothetical protein